MKQLAVGVAVVIVVNLLSKARGTFGVRERRGNVFYAPLDERRTIAMHWEVLYKTSTVAFEITAPRGFGWFALGFSNRGEKFPADYCLLWFRDEVNGYLEDTSADVRGLLHVDKKQDCEEFKLTRYRDFTKFAFKRKFDTCDNVDYIIQEGTTNIVWARGTDLMFTSAGLNINVSDSSLVRVQLLKTFTSILSEPSEILDVLTYNVDVPDSATVHWCHTYRLPPQLQTKHHVVRYEPIINYKSGVTAHRMEVFQCTAHRNEELPLYAGSCFSPQRPSETQTCTKLLATWALGGVGFTYPQQAGLPIGGDDVNRYVMLEIHYHNQDAHESTTEELVRRTDMDQGGIVDGGTGIRFYVSPELRKYDAGILELGLERTEKMAIPPDQHSFSLSGFCVGDCTAVGLRVRGMVVFGSLFHTYSNGRQVVTRHIRNGQELPELDRDNHFSPEFQEIRTLKKFARVLPGDALITTCEYTTEKKRNVTLGGFGSNDELCVNYVFYYPAAELGVCKSSISDRALKTYFEQLRTRDNQRTSRTAPVSLNFDAIEWNPMRVQHLKDTYADSPLSMQCSTSSGGKFAGYWENTKSTPVQFPLSPPRRLCAAEYGVAGYG